LFSQLESKDPLIQLANTIDWAIFDNAFVKHSKQSHYILTDNILLSTIEKLATSYHTQPNFLPKQKNSSGN
jgi:hypothetical protein